MVRAAALILAIVLAGCDDAPVTRSEAQDIASDYATNTGHLEERIASLEKDVAELRKQNIDDIDNAQRAIELLSDHSERASEAERRLFENDKTLHREANRIRAQQGLQPIPYQE